MQRVVSELLGQQYAWVPTPELRDWLLLADILFQNMLNRINSGKLLAGRYTFHYPTTDEPDDGIIVKRSQDTGDPSIARTGVPPDNKVFIHMRSRTKRLFVEEGVYDRAFDDFFEVTDEIRRLVCRVYHRLFVQLRHDRPDLERFELDLEESVLRLMRYDDSRADGSGLAGKPHTDKKDITAHLWDSSPGLILMPRGDIPIEVPTRTGETLLFVAEQFAKRTAVPALLHAAKHDPNLVEPRRIAVYFGKFLP